MATRKAAELDRRLKRFARRLQRDELEGVEFRDGRLQVSPVKATITPEARAFADVIEAMMPRVRITELLHEVNRATSFVAAFTNLRTGSAATRRTRCSPRSWRMPPISASVGWRQPAMA